MEKSKEKARESGEKVEMEETDEDRGEERKGAKPLDRRAQYHLLLIL